MSKNVVYQIMLRVKLLLCAGISLLITYEQCMSEIQTSLDFRQFSFIPDNLDFRHFFLSEIQTLNGNLSLDFQTLK